MMEKNYITCKASIPQPHENILYRRGISETIENASTNEIIYLVAPYGSGKTLAVLSWLNKHKKKAAWLTLFKNDDTPEMFWVNLIASILIFAGEHEEVNNIYTDVDCIQNPYMYLHDTLIRVSPKIDEKIMIIDGFCNIKNGGLLREIKETLSNMLGCWRIILIARSELPPLFNDFVLKKNLRLLNLKKLNFDFDEIQEYFNLGGYSISMDEARQLYRDTDGWPAALNAVQNDISTGCVKFNETSRAYVMGYFETGIWEHLSETHKDFLIKTSIIDRLTPSICHFVVKTEDADHVLRELYGNGLFITKLDGRDSYSYHHLFREFLLEKLRKSGYDMKSLYISAGWWLYDQNESIPALICFYHAKFLKGINTAFKRVKPADMGMDNYIRTALCLTSLDIMELKQYPSVAARIALLHFLTNNIIEMQRIYEILKGWLEPGFLEIPPTEYLDFFWDIGWLRYLDPNEDILFNPDYDNWVNVGEYAPHILEYHRARSSTLRLPSILRGVRDFSKDVSKLLDSYAMNNATHKSIRDDAAIYLSDLIYAEVCYEREDYEQAENTITKIISAIQWNKYTEMYFSCIVLLVKIARAIHNPNEIEELTIGLRNEIEKNGHLFLLPNFHAFELQNRLANGISGMTEAFENENKPTKDKAYYFLIYLHITYVRALISENKLVEASLILGNLDYLLRQYKRNMDLIEINILRSVTEYRLGHKTEARKYLISALERGQRSDFIRIFADDAIHIWPILNLLYKRDSNKYIEKIKVSCKLSLERSGINVSIDKTVYDPLTIKELNILKLLHIGMKYKDIALQEKISHGTVKWHVNNIYSKLHVKNKTEAIMVATKNKII